MSNAPRTKTISVADCGGHTIVGDCGGLSEVTGFVETSNLVFGALAVETEHGTLYLDPDDEITVVDDDEPGEASKLSVAWAALETIVASLDVTFQITGVRPALRRLAFPMIEFTITIERSSPLGSRTIVNQHVIGFADGRTKAWSDDHRVGGDPVYWPENRNSSPLMQAVHALYLAMIADALTPTSVGSMLSAAGCPVAL